MLLTSSFLNINYQANVYVFYFRRESVAKSILKKLPTLNLISTSNLNYYVKNFQVYFQVSLQLILIHSLHIALRFGGLLQDMRHTILDFRLIIPK